MRVLLVLSCNLKLYLLWGFKVVGGLVPLVGLLQVLYS